MLGQLIYSYSVPATNGYDDSGNLKSYTDSVMGTWNFSYDTLNRVAGASDNQASNPDKQYCWSYDAFGNRTLQAGSSAAFTVGSPTCTPASGATYDSVWANQSTSNNNRLGATTQAPGGVAYDAAGDVTNDGVNTYLYDAEGRICATSATVSGTTTLTGYIYDASGERIAKGSITSMSCNPSSNGFQSASDYILGPGSEQVTEMKLTGGVMQWVHTNVWTSGKLLGTYDVQGLHFYLDDPLGTRRAQTNYAGVSEQTCSSLPFGDHLSCTGSITAPTEHHFTGKERDPETGNDFFEARYYGSAIGRFMSPDWAAKEAPVPYATFDDPQSLNLYSYVKNNPLSHVDADGHCCDWSAAAQFVNGALNAFVSDNALGAGRVEQTTNAGRVGAAFGDTGAAIQGATEFLAGTGGNIAGFTLDATGVGALVGVPANVVSTAVMIHGSAAAVEGVTHLAMGKLAHSATGKGSVPPEQRAPQRTATPKQKADKLAEQGGNCANCGEPPADGKGIGHHYPDRHADGGKDIVNVCDGCHKELHSGSN